jgi:anthraniloyl-CoA monooxygenase
VARTTPLALMQQAALDTGDDVRFSTEVQPDDVVKGYDPVVAADGAHSRLRERFADVVRPSFVTATAKFIWFGTMHPFEGHTFVHERGPHGVFAVHGYRSATDPRPCRGDRQGILGCRRTRRVRRHPAARCQ